MLALFKGDYATNEPDYRTSSVVYITLGFSMFRPPRCYRKNFIVPLYRLKKVTPPVIWVVMFLLCCFMLPFGIAIKIMHPGFFATLRAGLEIAAENQLYGAVFVTTFLVLGSFLMFIVNGAFVSLRVAAGYEVRRNGTILKWLINKVRRAYKILNKPND